MVAISTSCDAILLSQLYQNCFNKTWGIEALQKQLEHPHTHALIAENFGFCIWQEAIDTADLWYIATVQEARQQGIATQLWQHMLQHMRQRNMTTVLIEVSVSNHTAIRFYQTMGCEEISVRKNYYRNDNGTREDALLLHYRLA